MPATAARKPAARVRRWFDKHKGVMVVTDGARRIEFRSWRVDASLKDMWETPHMVGVCSISK